jgi:hypothetical protein
VYQEWIERASREEMSYGEFLKGLLTEEVCARKENQLKRRMRQARFPYEKTIEQFDFTLRPELKRQVILSCMDPTFISGGKSLVLVGPPGTGKPQPEEYPSRVERFLWRECGSHRSSTSSLWENTPSSSDHQQTVSGMLLCRSA